MGVYDKLLTVQSELKAPKNQYNSFGKYKYRSCEDIQEGLKPLLKEVQAVVTTGDELVLIGERYYIKATATFIDTLNGEKVENTAYAREEFEKKGMDGSQITGTASSYARKYALNGLFCIDDTKDADSTDNSKMGNQAHNSETSNTNTDNQSPSANRMELLKVFETEMVRTKQDRKHVLEKLKVSDPKFIKTEKLIEFNEALKKLPTKE